MSARLMILGLLLCVVVAGCATFKNTPRQDYTWEIGRACSGESAGTIQLTRVEPAGRYWYFGGPAEFSWFRECMTRKFQETPYKAWLEQHKADYEAKR